MCGIPVLNGITALILLKLSGKVFNIFCNAHSSQTKWWSHDQIVGYDVPLCLLCFKWWYWPSFSIFFFGLFIWFPIVILPFRLSSLGKTVKKEPGNEEGQQHFDDADKLLQEFQEAQVDRVGSRPSSNLSSLSNASERDQHHLGICSRNKSKKKKGAQRGALLMLFNHNLQF